jgi:subtilisin family serine protease
VVVGVLGVALVVALPGAAAAARPITPDRLAAEAVDAGGATTVIVRYREGTSAARKAVARGRAHATRERDRPDKGREVVRPDRGRSVEDTVRALRADPAVSYAEPNYPIRLAASPGTEPLRTPYQWGLENAGGECVQDFELSCASNVDIDAAAAWPVSTGAGVVVAVLDDGLDFTHPDLDTQAWTNPDETANGKDDDANGFVDDIHGVNLCAAAGPSTELHGAGEDFHGTGVASVAAAATDDEGMAGVAPDARLMAVRWLIDKACMDTEMAAAAIEYAVDEGADVINASWGSEQPSATLLDAVQHAAAANVLIVAAAGNEVGISYYPAKFDTPNVLSVAAIAPTGYLASFSNRGSWVDMAAPGQSILIACVASCPSGYAIADGTSFAAPHVAGVAAQLLAIKPELGGSVSSLRSKLINSGVRSAKLDEGLTTSGRRLNARYALDVTAPSAPAVRVRAKLGSTIGSSSTAMAITWSASTDASGIESYRVRVRKTGTTTWTTIAGATTSRSAVAVLAYSQAYELQVTARDRGANSTTTTLAVTPKRYSESSSRATYTGAWSLVTSTRYQGGKARATTTAGRKVRYDITGRSIAWVAATGPTRGSARIWVDGVYVASVSLHASSTSYRKVVWSRSWSSSGPHSVTFVVSGTSGHPRVDVDAMIVAR